MLLVTRPVHAQETAPSGSEENAEAAAKFAVQEAQRYKIVRDGADKPLVLQERPLLRWSNPLRAEVYGSVLLWTDAGCPAALGSIYRYFDRAQVNSELVSLSEAPLQAERSGKLRWKCDAGVKFVPLANGPQPAVSTEKRQLQMRSLARKFTGRIAERDDETKLSELRLMARPLYQYVASDRSGREGSLFAYVSSNDPEILLLIESRPDGDDRSWHYAAARLNFCALQLSLADKLVWDVSQAAPPWERIRGPQGNYVILEWKSVEQAEADAK